MTTIPPPPAHPPTVGAEPPAHTPVPIDNDTPATLTVDEAAERFWAPAGRLLTDWWLKSGPEHITTIASHVGQQMHTLLTETETQRAAREQVQYEDLIASQRAVRDAQFAALGETPAQRAERHRVEKALAEGDRYRRDDLVHLVDMLSERINETPDERAARKETEREIDKRRRRAEEDRQRAAAGETPEQRTKRHRTQRLADQREAKQRARRAARKANRTAGLSDRTRRFRRWCTLTAASAIAGFWLVDVIAPGGPYVGLLLALFGWGLDLRIRDWGRQRVSEVHGALPLAALVICRVPVAAGLTVATGLSGALAALPL